MDADYEECGPASTTMSTAASTPTNSTVADDIWEYPYCTGRDAVPWAGGTFIIRERIDGRVITLKDGKLRLEHYDSKKGGCHWVCVEQSGWLGFRNHVSGTYIGHDRKGNFHAKEPHHELHEYFCARRHPDGGYLLLMIHGSILWKMDIGEDGSKLVETKGDGTTWEFLTV